MNTKINQKTTAPRPPVVEWVRRFNKKATNRLTMRFAGKHIYAVIHHSGRRSGKPYQTPVVAVPANGGFIMPLPYDENVDWCRNVMAAGQCQMDWQGRVYTLCNPQIIEPELALPYFPGWQRSLLKKTKCFLKMERSRPPELPGGQSIRKILVYGAGVLGSLYAGKLQQAGCEVTLLARGERLAEVHERGLVLVDNRSSRLERIPIHVTERLEPEDAYDLVMVVMRKNQVPSVLPALAANRCTPNVLFMVNNAAGPGPMIEALGKERVLLGFPGAGGQRENGIVRYQISPRSGQPTTIGELDGSRSVRLNLVTQVLEDAGFPAAQSENMDAWLKTHVALVSPVANALYMAGGSNYRLARTPDGLLLMVRAVKEGMRVLQALHIPITPAKYRVLAWLPEPLLVAVVRRVFNTPQAELVLSRHANAARDEMLALAEEFRELARQAGIPTPAIDALFCYTDPSAPAVPEGQSTLKMNWRSTATGLGMLASWVLLAGWLFYKRRK